MKSKSKPAKPVHNDADIEMASETNVVALLNKVEFSPDNVVDAAAMNPVLFVKAIEYRLHCMHEKTRAEMNAKRIKAETELGIRSDARENGEKITEGHISSKLILDATVRSAVQVCETAEVYDEYSKLVVEAFRMRRDCLRIVSEMTRSEMSVGRAVEAEQETMTAVREKIKAKFPG